jgi:hypothetical protein
VSRTEYWQKIHDETAAKKTSRTSGIVVLRVKNEDEDDAQKAIDTIKQEVCWWERRKLLGLKYKSKCFGQTRLMMKEPFGPGERTLEPEKGNTLSTIDKGPRSKVLQKMKHCTESDQALQTRIVLTA